MKIIDYLFRFFHKRPALAAASATSNPFQIGRLSNSNEYNVQTYNLSNGESANEVDIMMLKQKAENGEISENDLTEEQKEKIMELFDQEILELKIQIEQCKKNIMKYRAQLAKNGVKQY